MESIATTLFSLYRGTPFRDEWMIACLSGAWTGLLGERIAVACRPVEMRGPELVVEVADAAWLPALSSMKSEMLERIRAAAGNEVRQMSFVVRHSPDSGLQNPQSAIRNPQSE